MWLAPPRITREIILYAIYPPIYLYPSHISYISQAYKLYLSVLAWWCRGRMGLASVWVRGDVACRAHSTPIGGHSCTNTRHAHNRFTVYLQPDTRHTEIEERGRAGVRLDVDMTFLRVWPMFATSQLQARF